MQVAAKDKKLNVRPNYFFMNLSYPREQIWKDYDEEAEKAAEVVESSDPAALKTEYLDIIISDVRTTPAFGFSVQILNTEGISFALCALRFSYIYIFSQESHPSRNS